MNAQGIEIIDLSPSPSNVKKLKNNLSYRKPIKTIWFTVAINAVIGCLTLFMFVAFISKTSFTKNTNTVIKKAPAKKAPAVANAIAKMEEADETQEYDNLPSIKHNPELMLKDVNSALKKEVSVDFLPGNFITDFEIQGVKKRSF